MALPSGGSNNQRVHTWSAPTCGDPQPKGRLKASGFGEVDLVKAEEEQEGALERDQDCYRKSYPSVMRLSFVGAGRGVGLSLELTPESFNGPPLKAAIQVVVTDEN